MQTGLSVFELDANLMGRTIHIWSFHNLIDLIIRRIHYKYNVMRVTLIWLCFCNWRVMCMSNKMVFGYSFINATQLFISYYSKLTHTPMHQPNNPSLNIKISYRYHKTTNKPINKYSSVGPISYSKDINQINKLRRTYTPHKITNKQIPSSLQSEFNLCSSKNVFVFARKSSSPAINPSHFVPTKDNYYSREMTE